MYSITSHHDIKNIDNDSVLVFYANWDKLTSISFKTCSKLESEFNVKFVGIDVDAFKPLVAIYGVDSAPTFVFIKFLKEVDRVVGHAMLTALRTVMRKNFG